MYYGGGKPKMNVVLGQNSAQLGYPGKGTICTRDEFVGKKKKKKRMNPKYVYHYISSKSKHILKLLLLSTEQLHKYCFYSRFSL